MTTSAVAVSYLDTEKQVRVDSVLQREIKRLVELHGKVSNKILLDAATDPSNPLHSRFDWDDQSAGHKYRLLQASRMIQAVQILSRRKQKKLQRGFEIHVPAYPSVGHGVRKSRAVVLSDEEHRKYLVKTKLQRLRAIVMSVSDVSELDVLRNAVLKLVDSTAASLGIEL